MKNDSVFVYSDQLTTYKFNDDHPFNQLRLEMTVDLLKQLAVLNESQIIAPRMASDEELELIHTPEYIHAVKQAGKGELSDEEGQNFGIGTEDTPIFLNMHQASSLIVGATLTAVDQVLQGKVQHAISLGGGLHHGFPGKASGFCIYNDSAVAIKYIQKKYNMRVLYVDTDAHHGDGVELAFNGDPDVCTFSIHETGRYLFPGTGHVDDRGHGDGYLKAFNLPMDAFTEDESWLDAYTTAFREIVEYFKPDVILTQNGVDSHYYDPLTHLSTTMKSYREIPRLAHELAHQYCEGRWIAVGGGGYDIWRVVPRAWAMVWLAMLEKSDITEPIPKGWLDKWKKISPVSLPLQWDDQPGIYPAIPRKAEITEKNANTLARALYPIQHGRI